MTSAPNADRGYSEYAPLMKRVVWPAMVALAVVAAACGSGGAPVGQNGEPVSTETPRSERAEREATIMQQEQTQVGAEVEPAEVPSDDEQIAGVTEVGEIDFGHREGLPYLRNSVGDPDAPVVIVEYSDFQ